ncbi:alpha/beta fold hydrolase [Sphingomonas crusticola]|uniref:alpha/beta fold hydrolase n=1 Tax=Sphingomonas crusticola TaxID=1697973 RepID=UPI0013C33058|nr:alpha/beta hydrolase [Sphingomonas crusticola]
MRHVDVDVGDGALRTLVAGAGPEVVMLHGWTLDHRSWLPQLPLADEFRLVLPDRRGFGRSTAPAGLAAEWRDVDCLVDSDPFVLVGLSQGASVALDYARHRPSRLAALVLVGAPLHGAVAHQDAERLIPRDHYAELVRTGQLAAMKSDWAAHPLVRASPAAAPLLAAMLNDYDGRDLLERSGPIAIRLADIAALPMPVLAIAGTKDTEWRRRIAQFIGVTAPRGQAAVIDGAGHLCNLDNPGRFNLILAEFLSSILH